jgi:hypothetical protein
MSTSKKNFRENLKFSVISEKFAQLTNAFVVVEISTNAEQQRARVKRKHVGDSTRKLLKYVAVFNLNDNLLIL